METITTLAMNNILNTSLYSCCLCLFVLCTLTMHSLKKHSCLELLLLLCSYLNAKSRIFREYVNKVQRIY